MFEQSLISIWNISLDDDEHSVNYLTIHQALDSIESFINIQITDCPAKNQIMNDVMSGIKNKIESAEPEESPIVTLFIGSSRVRLNRIVLDKLHPIHKVLECCFHQVDDDTKGKISLLFN